MLDTDPGLQSQTTTTATGFAGDRQLVCVQTFDIARLTTHPVVLIPGSFVAVGGRGPAGDSNESGKTSFLAATGLLLGDPEWRMTGGGPASAASLLFEPETAGVAAHTYPAARHGYVIGVFVDPYRPMDTALTVWCRINATAPYFLVRYTEGEHLVQGATELERYDAVDALWDAMPSSSQLGPHTYAERLYGDSPRCLAYVARRGKQRSQASLLQMSAGSFSPEQIGDDLIRLTGRAAAFETEGQQRQRLAEGQNTLNAKAASDERARREEEEALSGVRARNTARDHLLHAEGVWRLHFARGYLDVLGREAELTGRREQLDIEHGLRKDAVDGAQARLDAMSVPETLQADHDAAEREAKRLDGEMTQATQAEVEARVALDNINREVRRLDEEADGWTAPSAAEVELELQDAGTAADQAQQDLGAANSINKEATERLRAVEAGTEGRAGQTAELLRREGIDATPLHDVELDSDARTEWEPRLALYDSAVVVAPGGFDDALIAAADRAGSVLIAGEEGPLPDGVTNAPAGAAGFLHKLAAAAAVHSDPQRAVHEQLGVAVIGEFAEPQTGHATRLERARQDKTAEALVAESQTAVRTAAIDVERLQGNLARARAAEALVAAKTLQTDASTVASAAQQTKADLTEPLQAAQNKHLKLAARLESYEMTLQAAKERVEARGRELNTTINELAGVKTAIDNLQVEYWRTNWGDSADAAEAELENERRTEKRLRNRAAELLQDALSALDIQSDGTGAPTEQLKQVARRRSALDEDPERGRVPARLDEVARPLNDYLDTFHEPDQVIAERIERARAQRQSELELANDEVERLDIALATLQDGVEQRIRQALEAISDEYDRLNRESGWFGADLHIEARRPDGPSDRWRWSVTPRWKRSANGRALPYDNQANTAQEKLATVQLVLAALLAAPNPRGRVLVLDELGDSLGVAHRREVLREIAQTAQSKGVTVLGTCQDSVMADASQHCGGAHLLRVPQP